MTARLTEVEGQHGNHKLGNYLLPNNPPFIDREPWSPHSVVLSQPTFASLGINPQNPNLHQS